MQSNTALSLYGILSTENAGSICCSHFSVCWITVKFLSPKKSNFNSPKCSNVGPSNCVTLTLSAPTATGTYSPTSFWLIRTPDAWTDACLGRPSSLLALSIRSCTVASCSYSALNSALGLISLSVSPFMALSIVTPTFCGIILAMLSTIAYGRSITRPTSLITALAAIVPNVIIWHTHSLPYFSIT